MNLPLHANNSLDRSGGGALLRQKEKGKGKKISRRRVVVLDDGPVPGGETCRTTAHLVSAPDTYFMELERMHGEEQARWAGENNCAPAALGS